MAVVSFDEQDLRVLIRTVEDNIRRRLNTENRSGRIIDETNQSPELYIALSPLGGIPAMYLDLDTSGTGTGSGTGIGEGNTPGYAECDIYKISHKDQGLPNILSADFSKQVIYNLSESDIEGDTWIIVARDKYGSWLVIDVPTVTGQRHFLRGKLDDILAFGQSATMSVWAFNGTSTVDTGENITVHDWFLSSGQTIAAGTQVGANWDGESTPGRWIVTGAQCP